MATRRTIQPDSTEFRDFLDDVAALLDSSSTGDIRAEIEKRIKTAKAGLKQAYNGLADQSSEFADRAREGVERGLDYSRDTVTEHPLSSVGVAAVGGLIVGLLLGSRR